MESRQAETRRQNRHTYREREINRKKTGRGKDG
jgi:hypothetical protein